MRLRGNDVFKCIFNAKPSSRILLYEKRGFQQTNVCRAKREWSLLLVVGKTNSYHNFKHTKKGAIQLLFCFELYQRILFFRLTLITRIKHSGWTHFLPHLQVALSNLSHKLHWVSVNQAASLLA